MKQAYEERKVGRRKEGRKRKRGRHGGGRGKKQEKRKRQGGGGSKEEEGRKRKRGFYIITQPLRFFHASQIPPVHMITILINI